MTEYTFHNCHIEGFYQEQAQTNYKKSTPNKNN